MSGAPQYDILLWLDNINTWTRPENEKIDLSERDRIVTDLEAWLRKEMIRSDAFPDSPRK
jgi:hypothetical protein